MASPPTSVRWLAQSLLLSTVASASAVDMLARQTHAPGGDPVGFAVNPPPLPTSPPSRRFGAMPALDARATGANVCGFISGTDSYYPLSCSASNTCTNYGTYRGCCAGSFCSSSENFYTVCHAATEAVCSASVGPQTLCCTSNTNYPYCVTFLFTTTASPGKLYTQFNCDQQTFSGQYILAASAPTTTSSSTSSSTGSTGSTTASGSSTPAPNDPGNSAANGGQNTQASNGGGSETPVGAIVGGVIGGVAVLALVGFIAWYLVWRRNSGAATAAAASAAQQQHHHQHHAATASPVGQQQYFHDPRYSLVPGAAPVGEGHSPNPYAKAGGGGGGGYPDQQHHPYQHTQQYDPAIAHPTHSPGGQGYFQPPPQQTQQQQGGFVAHEAPANPPVGFGGNYAEMKG